MKHKGYEGTVEFSEEDNILHGVIIGIVDVVSYEGASVDELRQDFELAVDDYLVLCEKIGKEPNKPYKGSFNVRMGEKIHRRASAIARKHGQTLNYFVTNATKKAIEENEARARA